jgi:hypothetical protein
MIAAICNGADTVLFHQHKHPIRSEPAGPKWVHGR